MNPYPASFCSAAQKVLDAVLGFDPPWSLSGRAAIWFRTAQTGPVHHLGLVWHCRDRLGVSSVNIRSRLAAAGLTTGVGIVREGLRRLRLGVFDGETSCALWLTAEPEAALERASQFQLHDRFIYVESWRDLLQMTLCSLADGLNPEDLGDLFLLLRRGTSLDLGLRDALRRDPRFDPERLAGTLDRFKVIEADPPPGVSLEEFVRFRRNTAVRILAWARSR